jgi:streptogramin lyase
MNKPQTHTHRPANLLSHALVALCTTLGIFALVAAPASAKPKVNGEFAVSGVGTNNDLTRGPDGNVWVTLDQTNDIAKITPDGTVTEYNPANVTSPIGITSGPDGNLWVTQSGGVASFSPADPDAAVKYSINDITDARPIVTGPDGNLWTVSGANVIRIPAANPAGSTSFPVLVAGRDIDAGSDGNLWVADFGSQVVSVTTAGVPTAYPTGAGSGLQAIAAGPNGQVAYADPTSNPQQVGRISPGANAKKTTTPGDPFGVAFGADGAYWIPRFAAGDLVRLTTGGKETTLRGLSPNAGPRRIATGPHHTLWVTLDGADKVARITGVTKHRKHH